jgi:hypothetical protein
MAVDALDDDEQAALDAIVRFIRECQNDPEVVAAIGLAEATSRPNSARRAGPRRRVVGDLIEGRGAPCNGRCVKPTRR